MKSPFSGHEELEQERFSTFISGLPCLMILLIVACHDSMFLEAFQRRFDLQSVFVRLECSSVSEIMTYFFK